jgi:hypothetical protein
VEAHSPDEESGISSSQKFEILGGNFANIPVNNNCLVVN